MQILSVSEFLKVVNETLALIPSEEMVIEGEISDYRLSQQKWISFNLKDENEEAALPCFATTYQLKMPLENGMRVQVKGYSRVYERFGKYSLNVREVQLVGEGALAKAYEMLKKKLEAEGLFDISRKRELSRFPARVGISTSREAAAYTDFLRISNNRWSGVEMSLYAVHVQGQHAVREILEAFEYFNSLSESDRPDVLVLTRGGGSLEDLHAFNDEAVARAVFGSIVPVVVGVGHERDESLADFVADVRASTPSNAAERIFEDRSQVISEIARSAAFMEERLRRRLEERSVVIRQAGHAMNLFFERLSFTWSEVVTRLNRSFGDMLVSIKERIVQAERLLKQIDPAVVLSRGYSIVKSGNRVVTDVGVLEVHAPIQVQLAHGSLSADVTEIKS